MDLKDLGKKYLVLESKYALPSFRELNENFEIDKIDKEGECLLRTIRKVIMEKIVNSINFIELLINPVNAPRVYLMCIKNLGNDEKKEIEKIYSVLGDMVIESLSLEIDYSEKKEAELIKKLNSKWNELKPSFNLIIDNMKKPYVSNGAKEKSYFG